MRRVRENAAISLGRVASVAPQPLAGHLGHFLGTWCNSLAALRVRPLPPLLLVIAIPMRCANGSRFIH